MDDDGVTQPGSKGEPPKAAELTDSERNEATSHAAGSKIVGAVGTAVGRGAGEKDAYSRFLETAMVKATEDAAAEGITDPDAIKARKATALAAAKEDWETRAQAAGLS
jgi:hypothetical protein